MLIQVFRNAYHQVQCYPRSFSYEQDKQAYGPLLVPLCTITIYDMSVLNYYFDGEKKRRYDKLFLAVFYQFSLFYSTLSYLIFIENMTSNGKT